MAESYRFNLDIDGPDGIRQQGLDQGRTTIGRVPGNLIVLGHPLVSRAHAQIECSGTECSLTDLGSANGTVLNGQKLAPNIPEILVDGAVINIGPFVIRFSAAAQAIPKEAEEQVRHDIPESQEPAKEAVEVASVEPEPISLPAAEKIPEPTDQGMEISRIIPASPYKETKTPNIPPPPQLPHAHTGEPPVEYIPPPGLGFSSQRLIQYLPGIYLNDFMSHFLALFESILIPIEWNIDNFDLYLDPGTSPAAFLPWLANWYEIVFDSTWSEAQRRILLKEAHQLYSRRGTKWALTRLLEIYTGRTPDIIEFDKNIAPYTFIVRLPVRAREVNQELIIRLIDSSKPAYTNYSLEFKK